MQDFGTPGKRTLTEALPLIQCKAREPSSATGPAENPIDVHAAAARGTCGNEQRAAKPPAPEVGGGLPPDLRARMEAAFGADFSGVRVHQGGEAARAGALAYTQGDDLYFAPGQYDPASRQGQELIGHELAHVVQQRDGRVTAQGQAAGLELNTDPTLEREADDHGARAVAGQVIVRTGGARQDASPPAQRKIIQRRVGFEFESACGGWSFEGKLTGTKKWERIAHTKATLLRVAGSCAELSADNGNVEFRTTPLETLESVVKTMTELSELHNRFKDKTTYLEGPELATAIDATGKNRDGDPKYESIKITGTGNLLTRPQATAGVKLSEIPALLTKLAEIHGGNAPNRSKEKPQVREERLKAHYSDLGDPLTLRRLVGGGVADDAKTAVETAAALYAAAAADQPATTTTDLRDEIVGLLTLILKSLFDASRQSTKLQDIKQAFSLMPRTDLRSMFMTMEPDARAYLTILWGDGYGPLATKLHKWASIEARVFPQGYRGDDGTTQTGPTIAEWIDSTVVDGKQKDGRDNLSPAAGYDQLEGFGSLGADDKDPKLVLLELRGLATIGETSTINPEGWLPLAKAVFQLIDQIGRPQALVAPAPTLGPLGGTQAQPGDGALPGSIGETETQPGDGASQGSIEGAQTQPGDEGSLTALLNPLMTAVVSPNVAESTSGHGRKRQREDDHDARNVA